MVAAGEYLIEAQRTTSPYERFRIEEVGDTFGYEQKAQLYQPAEVTYTVEAIDEQARTVTVTKDDPRLPEDPADWPEGQAPLTQTLEVVAPSSVRESAPAPSPEPATTPSGIDEGETEVPADEDDVEFSF
jgi:hypothetical protein